MIPTKGKTYKIDYWSTNPEEQELAYKGPALCLGDAEEDEDGNQLWYFETPDNCFGAMFASEDIIEEIKETKEITCIEK
jgi:hypothetical protein